jgi:hypothetical protein
VFRGGQGHGRRRRVAQERETALPCEAGGRSRVSIGLARTHYAAGEAVVALVDGLTTPARVALVRVERRPWAEGVVLVDEQHVREPYGVLALTLPPGALPTATGAGCSISYAVQVRADGVIARAGLHVSAEGRPHVAHGSSGGDPLIAGWDARHFHLELREASLRGGGWITGRVHRDGSWRSNAIVVRVRCDECWRPGGPAARGMPYWRGETLWGAEDVVGVDADHPWASFRFDLPPGLPPAVEARTIAWRYELRARRGRRYRPAETAALTPLLYDERASDDVLVRRPGAL